MADRYTGVRVIEDVDSSLIACLYKKKEVDLAEIKDKRFVFYPNQFLVMKSGEHASVLGRVSPDGLKIFLLNSDVEASGIVPRNKEQIMALNMLLDDSVPLNIMTGRAGTGKTLMALAVALQKIEEGEYERLILTRPMSQVGRYDLGALPGDVNEKFMPYQSNFFSNFEQLVGKKAAPDVVRQYGIEFLPLQLIRGASFFNSFILADEVQVLDFHEMLTLGTRVSEGSKLVVMGDLNQRDEKISREKTGLHKIMEDKGMKESGLVAAIELIKVERSPLAKLFADVFEE
jgi:PhoH-like ATPase